MTILVLDRELPEVENPKRAYGYSVPTKQAVEQGCVDPEAVSRSYKTKTKTEHEIVYRSTVPDDADLYHTNYLDYLSQTYAHHHSIVIQPQHFWYTLMCEMAQAVISNSDMHRKLFTRDPAGKIDIVVPCSSMDAPLDMGAIHAEMLGHVPVDTALFLPEFSTETQMSRMASMAAFLEMCTPYYSYEMYMCGHPAVKLLGSAEDWDRVVDRVGELGIVFAGCPGSPVSDWLRRTVLPIAIKLREAIDGEHTDWFREIFSEERCGSGGQKNIGGWFSHIFLAQPKGLREIQNFPSSVTKVPYRIVDNCQNETKWNLCFGLFSSKRDERFFVPDFSSVQVEKLAEPRISAFAS